MSISHRLPKLPGFQSPPSRSVKKVAPSRPHKDNSKAVFKEKKGLKLGMIAMQVGLAANSLAGGAKPAMAAEPAAYEMQMDASRSLQVDRLDLARDSSSVREFSLHGAESPSESTFRALDMTQDQAQSSLETFSETGRVYYKKAGLFKEDLTPDQATQRLYGRKQQPIFVQLADGKTHKIHNSDELQTLDTFQGLGIQPVASPQVVDALKSMADGVDSNDGLIQDDFLAPEKGLNAYEAYGELTSDPSGGKMASLKGAGIGTAVAVGLALGASVLFPAAAPAILTGTSLVAAGGVGMLAGAGVGYLGYKHGDPDELEVRHGQDFGFKVKNLDHAVETHQWLEDRAANPFTESQQAQALQNLDKTFGLRDKRKSIDAEKALGLLQKGKSVRVPSSIPNHYDTISSLRDLQQLDTVRGLKVNPVLPPDISESLHQLETGEGANDGLYKRGQFKESGRLSAFEAVDYLFREREPIGVKIDGKNYQTKTLYNIQELNALQGDGRNTILPQPQFDALQLFGRRELITSQGETPQVLDSYEALQEINEGRGISISSEGRQAHADDTADLHELRSLEFTGVNTILPQNEFDLLNYWEKNGPFETDGDADREKAYEALQSIQARTEFEVDSAGRLAPALTFQDLQDLASFEAPEAGFPNSVPAIDQDRLEYFQAANEAADGAVTRVGNRQGRAYEGYRQLRDGKSFDVAAGGVWNRVTSSESLHDLDAMLGRQQNDILPQDQYDLLKHLGDGRSDEGLAQGGRKLNSYGALQEFRQGDSISYDFHGGDFGELLRIPTANLEALDETKVLRDNQKDYDQYSYTVDEWQDKMERQFDKTPDAGRENLRFGERNLSSGQRKRREGESDLSDAERDLSRGKSDKRSGEWDLMSARSLPYTTTEYRTECDNDGCERVSYEEHNWERDRRIRRAKSDISDAERDIRRAKSDIDDAEDLIDEADRDIRKARGEISEANRLLGMLPAYGETLSSADESNYKQVMESLDSSLDQMDRLSNVRSLDRNIRRQEKLIDNMTNRPARPDGWEIPDQLVQR